MAGPIGDDHVDVGDAHLDALHELRFLRGEADRQQREEQLPGLAVDTGRAYVVKAQLTKAVDGAALAAARNINSGDPRGEAAKIYRANFPVGYMGTTSSTDPADAGFYSSQVIAASGVNIVTVTATAVLPTTFMKLGNFDTVTVSSTGEATRRMRARHRMLKTALSLAEQEAADHSFSQSKYISDWAKYIGGEGA